MRSSTILENLVVEPLLQLQIKRSQLRKAWEDYKDAPWSTPGRPVSDISYWSETSGKTHDKLERLYRTDGMGMPGDRPEGVGNLWVGIENFSLTFSACCRDGK